MPKIKIKYRFLGREKSYGLSHNHKNLIEIDKRLKGKFRFYVIIHELLHQIFKEKTESQILRAEKILVNNLWEQGYRFVDNKIR